MERFAHFVNLYFYRTAVSGGPNYLILLTISLGRRTIANGSGRWQAVFFAACARMASSLLQDAVPDQFLTVIS